MDKKIIKSSKVACYIALSLWSLWAVLFVLRVLRFAGIITFNAYMGIDIAPVEWIDDPEVVPVQWVELLGYIITTAAMIVLSFVFISKSLKGVSTDSVFNRTNARLLNIMAATAFFFELFDSNRQIIFGERLLVINSNLFVVPLVILVVAMFYRLALHAYEDSNLAI